MFLHEAINFKGANFSGAGAASVIREILGDSTIDYMRFDKDEMMKLQRRWFSLMFLIYSGIVTTDCVIAVIVYSPYPYGEYTIYAVTDKGS